MDEELLRRARDLAERCERTATVTGTGFLTPAQQYEINAWADRVPDCRFVLRGGSETAERKAGFFLPFWLEPEELDLAEHLKAVRITAGFGRPGHRDYLGSILGLGIRREWIGEIILEENIAYVVCLPSVQRVLLEQLEHVGRCGVKVAAVDLEQLPRQERKVKPMSFTVQSLRLDAVVSGLFRLSRTQAAEKIRLGLVSLNYAECLRPDAQVAPGDILSLRGAGKGSVTAIGGTSKKGRQFVECELWL